MSCISFERCNNSAAPNPQPPINQLDPGPGPRPRRKLTCKSILCGFLILVSLSACWIGYRFVYVVIRVLAHPNYNLHQKLGSPFRPQDVVRPLVDANQTFDIVATVWLRSDIPGFEEVPSDPSTALVLNERPIFTGTVFRGLTLKDKQSKTSVDLQMPTAIFKRKDLNNYDLRGSFVLVPNSPSMLDNATEYTSWKPLGMYSPPVRPWPKEYKLPLGEEIIDSYGVSVPMISFQNIQSHCLITLEAEAEEAVGEEDEYDDDVNEDSIIQQTKVGIDFQPAHKSPKFKSQWKSVNGTVLSAHPYVVTRSFLRVANITAIMNKTAYDEFHDRISKDSCRGLVPVMEQKTIPTWKDCIRDVVLTGTQEVRIKISTPSKKSGKNRTKWAYAPYLAPCASCWGPLDLVPVPVNRETCQTHSESSNFVSEEPTMMNITWEITFASRSPIKLWPAAMLEHGISEFNMTRSEADLARQQMDVEMIQRLSGYHPRRSFHVLRRFVLYHLSLILTPVASFLKIHYWYTRSSTVGISITGMSLVAGSILSDLFLRATAATLSNLQQDFRSGLSKLVSTFITSVGWNFTVILMIKAITRADINWEWSWIRFFPPTHAERASQRIDTSVSFRFKILVFTLQAAVLSFLYSQGYFLINSKGPVVEPVRTGALRLIASAYSFLVHPASNLGWILQIILNYRMKTFAGMYKTAAYVLLAERVFQLMSLSPWIVGESAYQEGTHYRYLFSTACLFAVAVQAYMYPPVSLVNEEDDNK